MQQVLVVAEQAGAGALAERREVLAVVEEVVVAVVLDRADLLAHEEHRRAGREHRQRRDHTRAGFGVQATFPAQSRLLRIPIDHVLASCTIGVRDRVIERDVGSDHLPIVVDLVVPR